MDWKEFLRPTKARIVLFIALFLLLPMPFFSETCGFGEATCFSSWNLAPFAGLTFLSLLATAPLDTVSYIGPSLPSIAGLVITSYLLSCLISVTFKRIKKGKQAGIEKKS